MSHIKILFLEDLHVGSAFGIMPDGFLTSSGSIYQLNPGQRYLYECWEHMVSGLPKKLDALILNGDVIDGQNMAGEGRRIVEIDPNFQVRAAKQLLKPVASRASRVYMLRGSEYHVGKNGMHEDMLGEILGAVTQSGSQRHIRPWLRLNLNGYRLDVAHRTSVTIRYRSMPLEREISFAAEFSGRTGRPMPNLIYRSHTHWGFGVWNEGQDRMAIHGPAWKLMDEHISTGISPNRSVPFALGGVVVRIFDRPKWGRRAHEDTSFLYEHPEMAGEEALCG